MILCRYLGLISIINQYVKYETKNIILLIFVIVVENTTMVAQTHNEIFSWLLGVEVRTDENIITQLLKAKHMRKIFVDFDNDGRNIVYE